MEGVRRALGERGGSTKSWNEGGTSNSNKSSTLKIRVRKKKSLEVCLFKRGTRYKAMCNYTEEHLVLRS